VTIKVDVQMEIMWDDVATYWPTLKKKKYILVFQLVHEIMHIVVCYYI
jgi:hypothetical protein